LTNYSTTTLGRSIDFEITNPSTDIHIVSGGDISTTNKINISGRTIVVGDGTDPATPDIDGCTTDITSLLSLNVQGEGKNPTIFYLKDCAVWKQEGGEEAFRLTNSNLKVHSLTFTELTGENSAGTVRIEMEISNVGISTDPNFMSVTRTYSTTATVKAWSGND
jgi:hypothetical protein